MQYARGFPGMLQYGCTAIFRMAIRTFEISRYFTVACSKDRTIGSGRLVKREVQMCNIGLADRRKCTSVDRNASILMARACSHFDPPTRTCSVRVQELTPTAVNRTFQLLQNFACIHLRFSAFVQIRSYLRNFKIIIWENLF